MMVRILFIMMFPFMCFSQITPSEDIPVNNILKEKENLDTKRKASYNLDEIKVRWKKAALENCPGVPCVVTPPAPSFTCGTSTVTDVDGNIYETVAIVGTGVTQCWTKTNLKATKYNDGVTSIPVLISASDWAAAATGARTVYGGSSPVSGYVDTYGYLYNWYAAAGIVSSGGSSTKNICPSGWHVPTRSDWNTLTSVLGTNPGTQLKENSTWSPAGTNTRDFSAKPGGYRNLDGTSTGSDIGVYTIFWSATVNFSNAYNYILSNSSTNLFESSFHAFGPNNKGVGASIRCLKD
jgi:uncharacterized protein (TIGR02145 family)